MIRFAAELDRCAATTWANCVHGHTHIAKTYRIETYRIGNTVVRSNSLGFAAKGRAAPGFSVKANFSFG